MESTKYQIFLSSTYSDLAEERENIIKAILEMYHIPIGMEMFSAEDEDQWEIIRRTIEVSDYYILVLGLRYGSKTSDGISFTQKEYEYALEKKIPILAFVMKDNVPLSMDRRDDDLSEINKFRELVLKNSRMAQFWETKDQLIKSVSIALMKQIMQKPGIGWIRGDKAGIDGELSKELTSLSKENRELRERVLELESKISFRKASIDVFINKPTIDEDFNSYKITTMPDALSFHNVPSHLHDYISEDDIAEYNREIPSQNELDNYNKESEKIYKINNYSTPLEFVVSNMGSIKATNVYIDFEFPDEFFIYENDNTFSEPKSPIPFNPIIRAQSEHSKNKYMKNSALSRLQTQLGDGYNVVDRFSSLNKDLSFLSKIPPINQKWWTKLDGKKITIKIDNLLHTRKLSFNDEYMIVPLAKGKHIIEVRIICEEYEEIEIRYIEIDI